MNRVLTVLLMATLAGSAMAQDYVFENLGVPCKETGHALYFTTTHPDGYDIAWSPLESPDFMGLLGIRLDTGQKLEVDLSMHGSSHVTATPAADGRSIYAYAGSPDAHFMRYDPGTGELTDLGAPAQYASYFSSGALAPDGRFYVGTYPRAQLVWVDTATGETGSAGTITADNRNKYIFPSVAVSDDNIVYCPVGLNHQELFAYNPATGTATQILPEDLSALPGSPQLWRAADGQVYGRSGGTSYLCTPTAIIAQEEVPGAQTRTVLAGDWRVSGIDDAGVLTLTHVETGEQRPLQTEYLGRRVGIYCVATEWDGKIWGGTMFPARAFSYDPATGEMVDYGQQTGGRIQIYDIMGTPQGLLLSSYTGAVLNFWNPNAPEGERANQQLARGRNQERPMQWVQGPDGHYYIGSRPIKGHVGGGLCRVTLDPLEATWWIDPIGPQSVLGAAPVPEIGGLLCGTSNYGGTSSIPEEPEGYIFLWDCAAGKVLYKDQPVPGARSYSAPVRADTGIVYGLSSGEEDGPHYWAYDPVKRETLFVGKLPGARMHFPSLHEQQVGPDGLIVGLLDDAVFAIDPADHSVRVLARDPSIAGSQGLTVSGDGYLYYGSGPELWRVRLFGEG